MSPNRLAAAAGALALAAVALCPGPAGASDAAMSDWFDVTVPSTAAEVANPDVVATRRSTFDADAAVHALVSPEDLKRRVGRRVVVHPATTTFGLRLVGCNRVEVVIDELALTAPSGENATASHPNVEVLGRVGSRNAVQATVSFVFIAEKGTGYHVVGGVNGGPASWDLKVTHVAGDTYRLDQPSRAGGGPNPRAVAQDRCSTRAVLPNTGLGAPRVLGPLGLGLVVLGSVLVQVSRKPERS